MIRATFAIIMSAVVLLFVSSVIAIDETLSKENIAATTDHEVFIRQTFKLAISAGKKGNHPFGALLVHQGKVILTAENTVNTDNDYLRHAEINLLTKARRELPRNVLRQTTMYTSSVPCMFCCAAIWYSGVERVVYGVSRKAQVKLTPFEESSIPCDKLHRDTGRPIEWIGPILEEEGLQVLCYWPNDLFRPSLLKKLEGREGMGRSCNAESR